MNEENTGGPLLAALRPSIDKVIEATPPDLDLEGSDPAWRPYEQAVRDFIAAFWDEHSSHNLNWPFLSGLVAVEEGLKLNGEAERSEAVRMIREIAEGLRAQRARLN